jgi:3-oxoadipate enol-lactonase
MHTFAVPGAELAVAMSDEGGQAVVQLHGLTASRERDRGLELDLGRGLSGTRLLRYDARGHGRSSGRKVPEDYRWQNLADDLLRLLDHWFPDERVHGVGPSMGTATLLHAATIDPDRFTGLTLMAPPTAWDTRPAQAEGYRAAADLIDSAGMEAYFASTRGAAPSPEAEGVPDPGPDVADALLPSVLRGAALSDLPDPETIARIEVPTSILAWTDDPGHPLSTAEALAGMLPRATLSVAQAPGDIETWPDVLRRDVGRRA